MYKEKGDKEKAREQFKRSIEFWEELGNKVKVEEVKKEMKELG